MFFFKKRLLFIRLAMEGVLVLGCCNVLETMNLPNIISLSRIPLVFLIVACLYIPGTVGAVLAFLLFVLGSASDWLDGFLARKYNLVSDFGKLMDALTDKVFVVGTCVAFLPTKVLPAWGIILVLIIIAREFFVTGLRLVAASRGRVLAAEKAGKLKTAIQMVSMGVLLFARVIGDTQQGASFFFYEVGLWLFVLGAGLTLYSGFGYLVKYGDLLKED